MSVFQQFWNEFSSAFERLRTWLPGSAMTVGDVGIIGRRGWQKMTRLTDLGVDYRTLDVKSNVSYSYASGNAVDISALAAVKSDQVVPGTDLSGGMKVTFNRGGAFVIRAENCRHKQIDNLYEVESALKSSDSLRDGWSDARWILVSEVVTAQPIIVLIARNAGAEATVEIRGVAGATGLAELGTAKGSLRLAHESSLDAHIVSVERTPPMWRGRVRRAWPLTGMRDLGGDEKPTRDRSVAAPLDRDDMVEFLPSAEDVPEYPA